MALRTIYIYIPINTYYLTKLFADFYLVQVPINEIMNLIAPYRVAQKLILREHFPPQHSPPTKPRGAWTWTLLHLLHTASVAARNNGV